MSPDGVHVVYTSGTPAKLYVRRLDHLDGEFLDGTENASMPFFSPDGDWVGFQADGELRKIRLTGGAPAKICDLPLPNGVARGASWGVDESIVFGTPALDGLFRVSAAGGDAEPLTALEPDETSHRWPQILPGGQTVLFLIQKGAETEVVLLNLSTGERQLLFEGGRSPRYLSTGHIVYGVGGTLWAVPFDLNRLDVTGDPVPVQEDVFTTDALSMVAFDVAGNGSLIYVPSAAVDMGRVLVWVDDEGHEELVPLRAAPYILVRVSPDGTRVAAVLGDPQNQDIWIGDLERGGLTRLATHPALDSGVAWSPDGDSVVFYSEREDTLSLFSVEIDGSGEAERILTIEDAPLGSFRLTANGYSRDGALIFTYSTETPDNWNIGLLSPEGSGDWTPLMPDTAHEFAPTLSLSGAWVAYGSSEGGTGLEVYVTRFPEPRDKVIISLGGGRDGVWSPDGQAVFYRWNGWMWRVPVGTGQTMMPERPQSVFEDRYFYDTGRRFDVHPLDGRFLMIKENDATEEVQIVLVENWHQELLERVPVR